MPRIRATGTGGAFVDTAGGSYWKLDGLEITDNYSVADSYITCFFDLRNGGKTTIHHCYVHPKEEGLGLSFPSKWTRHVRFGIWYEYTAGLEVKYCDFRGFLGHTAEPHTSSSGNQMDARVFLSIAGQNWTFEDNFLSAWYSAFFTGGGASQPSHTATLSGTPSMSSATFSTTVGLYVGQALRFNLNGAGTMASGVFTRTSGTVLTDADCTATYGTALTFDGGVAGYNEKFIDTTGDVYSFYHPSGAAAATAMLASRYANGAHTFTAFEMATVTNIAGSVVSYTPLGVQPLVQTPSTTNTTVSWSVGSQNVAANGVIRKNTIWVDPDYADYAKTNFVYGPKGIWEDEVHCRLAGRR